MLPPRIWRAEGAGGGLGDIVEQDGAYVRASAARGDGMTHCHQRVALFVDVQNMFYSAKHQYDAKLNFQKLLEAACRGRALVRAIAYVVQSPEVDQSKFLTMLKQTGYEVKSKELRVRPDGSCKGDWDMGLAIDAISMADKMDAVVLVSGDGDFVALVDLLKARGVKVEVFGFPHSTAEELRSAATEYYEIGPELLLIDQLNAANA